MQPTDHFPHAESATVVNRDPVYEDMNDSRIRPQRSSFWTRGQAKRAVHFDGSPDSWSDEFVEQGEAAVYDDLGRLPGRRGKSRPSQSLSDHAHNLFQKMHSAFDNNPTIVHRPNLRKKPTMPMLDTNTHSFSPQSHEPELATIDSSPSSYTVSTNGHSPPSQASTAPTSVQSNFSSPNSNSCEIKPIQEHSIVKTARTQTNCAEEPLLPSIEESLPRYLVIPCQESGCVYTPSVATVESTAAAKVYMEIHFNELMSQSASPRSLRRRKFEQLLLTVPMTDDQRQIAWTQWFQVQSNHLRQMRALKASSNTRRETRGVAIAGYESVRVLGKGSFGVVRLVTERLPEQLGLVEDKSFDPERRQIIPSRESGQSTDQALKRKRLAHLDPKDVYAMKVIRKSNMLRNCQEAHLRAERDFLVASEGSR